MNYSFHFFSILFLSIEIFFGVVSKCIQQLTTVWLFILSCPCTVPYKDIFLISFYWYFFTISRDVNSFKSSLITYILFSILLRFATYNRIPSLLITLHLLEIPTPVIRMDTEFEEVHPLLLQVMPSNCLMVWLTL